MNKRPALRNRWSGWQLGAGLCIAASIALIATALLQKGSDAQPQWTPVNAQVDRALVSLEASKADERKPSGGKGEGTAPGEGAGVVADVSPGADAAADAGPGANTGTGKSPAAEKAPAAGTKEAVPGSSASGTSKGVPISAGENTDGAAEGKASADSRATAGTESVQGATSPASEDGKVDINHASSEELDALPGIGAAKADAIVSDRERNGPFRSADDLLRVKGIGPKLLDKMKSFIVLRQ